MIQYLRTWQNQQIFVETVNFLLKQGRKANEYTRSFFYVPQNAEEVRLKCAIGYHIPPNRYNECMEEATLTKLVRGTGGPKLYVPELIMMGLNPSTLELLRDLLEFHDEFMSPKWGIDWRKNALVRITTIYNLTLDGINLQDI